MFEKIAERILKLRIVRKYYKKHWAKDRELKEQLSAIKPNVKEDILLMEYLVRKMTLLMLISAGLVVVIMLYMLFGSSSSVLKGTNGLSRNKAGEGSYSAELIAQMGSEDYPMNLTIKERYLSKEKIEELFDKAKAEIDESILGENESLDHIVSDVNLAESFCDGLVSATWDVSDRTLMDSSGQIKEDNLGDAGSIVNLTAHLSYRDDECDYQIYLKLFPKELTESELMKLELEEALEKADEDSADAKVFTLPLEVGGVKVSWKEPTDNKVPKLLVLGILILAIFIYGDRHKVEMDYTKRQEQLLIDYPQLVSKLSLLLEAGMTIGKAWEKIVMDYRNNSSEKRYVYEEMLIIYYQMQEGLGEREAYEQFGRRCALKEYLKLSSVIAQNLKKGSEGLGELLEAEVRDAFESRKSLAKRKGEEAGTKLLVPMMLMMVLVMAITVIPGLMVFSG